MDFSPDSLQQMDGSNEPPTTKEERKPMSEMVCLTEPSGMLCCKLF